GSGEPGQGPLHPHYPFQKEEELIRLVQLGDERGAKRILDELLADILFKGAGQMELTKARILELVIILSRAAVEGGASLEEVLGLRYHCIQDLAEGMPPENLYYWILNVLDRLMACMYQNRHIRHPRVFSRAKEYIWANYSRKLSQDEVARVVGLSTSYLSRLFRREMGISFTEYLTSVRIAASKRLMETTDLPLLDIIHQVGYEDPSHFSKVFKRSEGLTPSGWRAKAKILPMEEGA
ncbi:MAG: helix-turn-helix transcriptional regulator, partial [Nitrospinota bacterium]